MKKILLIFLFLIIIFTLRNQFIIKAENFENDISANTMSINKYNKENNITIKEHYKNIYKNYNRTILSIFNNKRIYTGKVDFIYTVYKHEGYNFDYYSFFYNTIISPFKDKNNINKFVISKNQVEVTRQFGDLNFIITPFKNNDNKVFYYKEGFSFYHDYNHKEINFSSYSSIIDDKVTLLYEYNRGIFNYLFNNSTKFLNNTHSTYGYFNFKTKKNYNQKLNIIFSVKMDYIYKFDNIDYKVNRDFHIK